jgi:hypothetical protein
MFPDARKFIGKEKLQLLGEEIAAMKAELMPEEADEDAVRKRLTKNHRLSRKRQRTDNRRPNNLYDLLYDGLNSSAVELRLPAGASI